MDNLVHEVFVLMLSLSRVSSEARVLSLFCEAMNVVAAPVVFRILGSGEEASGEVVEIRTASHHFGRVAIECEGSELSEQSMPVFRNAVAMLAVMLDRLRNIQLLADENLQKLQEREASMAEAQRIARIGQWEWDIRADCVQQSAQAAENLGVEGSPVRLQDFFDRVHPADRELVRDALRESLGTGSQYECSFRVVRSDRQERFLTVWGKVIRDPAGVPVRVRGVVQDITERTSLEQQLLQAQKLESLGRLAGGVAHDFNNLLTVINGYSDLALAQLSKSDPLWMPICEIAKAGTRAAELTKQLLAFSRRQVVEPKPVNVNQIITENRAMLARLIGEDVELVTSLSDVPDCVLIDPGQFHQVLMNLAVNSRDAMPHGGCLTIGTAAIEVDSANPAIHRGARPGPYVVLTVTDTGIGMDEDVRERIFEPFYTTKGPGEGTGLGLSTVYGIVRQCGGWISVESRLHQGTTFRIGLPRMAAGVEAAGAGTSPLRLRGTETVLLVEDQDDVRRLAAAVLRNYGYRVLEAGSGGEALSVAEAHDGPIHLVLADVVMPRISGRELVARLEANRPGIRALYMSGYTHDVISLRGALEVGVNCVQKPFTPESLAQKVREVLGPPVSLATILVADDNDGIRKFFENVLSSGGYNVIVARDSDEVLQMMHKHRIDLLVTDVVIPGRKGIETMKAIRESQPGLKILAVSGAHPETATVAGVNATLVKPVSPDRLLTVVRSLLS